MTNTKPVFHGSDIEKISEYYHIDQNSITNFAGNVNPLGLSPSFSSGTFLASSSSTLLK